MTDPRLMWFTVSGQGGAEELIWLERQEGYIGNFLRHYNITPSDTVVVFSHGGLNAAPVEVALHGKEKGATVIAVTCKDNLRVNKPVHSSGKRLADIADIVIDNCVSYEDAQVSIEGVTHKVGAVSTVAFIVIAQCLVVETAALLAESGIPVSPFVSPNVPGVSKDHNPNVFEQYNRLVRGL
ncbi:MAG: sugar isomerase domain-containing protein, partial [Bacillota bacterium]